MLHHTRSIISMRSSVVMQGRSANELRWSGDLDHVKCNFNLPSIAYIVVETS